MNTQTETKKQEMMHQVVLLHRAVKEYAATHNFDISESYTACNSMAKLTVEALKCGEIWGYFTEENHTAGIGPGYAGHDFVIVDRRFIVDHWIPDENHDLILTPCVWDLHDTKDEIKIREIYGNPDYWGRGQYILLQSLSGVDRTLHDLRQLPYAGYISVFGSVITSKESPNDVDIVADLRGCKDVSTHPAFGDFLQLRNRFGCLDPFILTDDFSWKCYEDGWTKDAKWLALKFYSDSLPLSYVALHREARSVRQICKATC